MGVHASPTSDEGPGFDTTSSDADIARLLAGVDSDWIVGGPRSDGPHRQRHTRPQPWQRRAAPHPGSAQWMVIDSDEKGARAEHRSVAFDVATVVAALHHRRHPNRAFVATVLTQGTFVAPT